MWKHAKLLTLRGAQKQPLFCNEKQLYIFCFSSALEKLRFVYYNQFQQDRKIIVCDPFFQRPDTIYFVTARQRARFKINMHGLVNETFI